MKAQKCPKCGYLNKICDPCDQFEKCHCGWIASHFQYAETVELIDWEYELITNNEYLKK